MKTDQINLRVDKEDIKVLEALRKKTGLSNPAIIRLAIRRLLEEENKRKSG